MSAVVINHPKREHQMAKTPKPVELQAPPLGAVLSYRVVHALCTVSKGELKATHYAVCLIGGSQPVWGVWTINGVFQRFFGRKSDIAEAYSHLTWRVKQSTWTLADVHDMDHEERSETLKSLYKKNITMDGTEMARAGLKVIGKVT